VLRWIRILAVAIVPPTIAALVFNGQRDGYENLYYLLPDALLCIALIAAAIHGSRQSLLVAYSVALGVFMTATFGDLWTEGLAGTPPGAAFGVVLCLAVIVLLMRQPRA
jgi:hypothetical protein